jgi:hypothetical protein
MDYYDKDPFDDEPDLVVEVEDYSDTEFDFDDEEETPIKKKKVIHQYTEVASFQDEEGLEAWLNGHEEALWTL